MSGRFGFAIRNPKLGSLISTKPRGRPELKDSSSARMVGLTEKVKVHMKGMEYIKATSPSQSAWFL